MNLGGGDETFTAGPGNNIIRGGPGDYIAGGPGNEVIDGGDGPTTSKAATATTRCSAAPTRILEHWGPAAGGVDMISGGDGDDLARARDPGDIADGGPGDDYLYAVETGASINGGDGDDLLSSSETGGNEIGAAAAWRTMFTPDRPT